MKNEMLASAAVIGVSAIIATYLAVSGSRYDMKIMKFDYYERIYVFDRMTGDLYRNMPPSTNGVTRWTKEGARKVFPARSSR